MKRWILGLVVMISAVSAYARPNDGFEVGATSCGDPRLLQHFNNQAEADATCESFSNMYYSVDGTFDYATGQYTCTCVSTGEQGRG